MEKTCGNCDSWRTVGIERGYCIFDNSLEDGCLKLHLRDDAACDKHTNAPLPLEQRYQQLAEVAKFLYQLSSDLFKSCGRENSFHLQLAKTQLEELGVEL